MRQDSLRPVSDKKGTVDPRRLKGRGVWPQPRTALVFHHHKAAGINQGGLRRRTDSAFLFPCHSVISFGGPSTTNFVRLKAAATKFGQRPVGAYQTSSSVFSNWLQSFS